MLVPLVARLLVSGGSVGKRGGRVLFACCARWCICALWVFPVRVLCELWPGLSLNNRVIEPTALVRPSRKIIFVPTMTNSGFLMKRKWHKALSPVRKCSWSMERIVAVCLKLPQWTMKDTCQAIRTTVLVRRRLSKNKQILAV